MAVGLDYKSRSRIGEILLREGLIDETQLSLALELQREWGGKLGRILISSGLVRRLDLYKALSKQLNLPFLDLRDERIDLDALKLLSLNFMKENEVIPIRIEDGKLLVAMTDPLQENTEKEIERITGLPVKKAITTELDIIWVLSTYFKEELKQQTIELLAREKAEFSAKKILASWQIIAFYTFSTVFLYLLFFKPILAFYIANSIVQTFFFLSVMFKLVLSLLGAKTRKREKEAGAHQIRDSELPDYTILIPVYKEARVIPHLIESIRRIDYPKSKLDVKILFEEDDIETLVVAKELKPEGFFEFIVVPHSFPKTKPKACNWGLQFARGKYITIYDAEDRPEPDQLKKAISTFKNSPPNTVCVQARLNYYNKYENFLTRMFTLEYSYWFDYILPGLELLGVPIPLGGTSNHFVTERLKEIGGWDPFNVTEDADLGVRAARLGYTVRTLDSTTYEEATSRLKNWINQRTRWIKGYMQTYAVHMRNPFRLIREIGLKSFIGFQLFIGGTPFVFLANPVLWILYIVWLLTQTRVLEPIFPPWVLYFSLLNLLIGNSMIVFMNMIAVWRRKLYRLTPWALLSPFYWILHSVAAWNAQMQLVSNPFYWEKTPHGISRIFTARKQTT